MRKILVLLMVTFLALTAFASAVPDNQVRVFLEIDGPLDVTSYGAATVYEFVNLPQYKVIEVPETALSGLLRNPHVIGYEYDAEISMARCSPWPSCRTVTPTQPAEVLPWGVNQIDAELSTVKGTGVKVCILDTGIDQDHLDLAANIVGGKNFVASGKKLNTANWNDDNGHGTHVAGTIAAIDNEIGVIGVAPQASLLAAKVLDRNGDGYVSNLVAGIDYCLNQGAKVISMSLATTSDVQALHDISDVAYANGVLLVAAAGNEYGSPVGYPAAYDSVIAVSASDANDNLAAFSNIGPEIEFAAPGTAIISTWNNGLYNTIQGTSMATPHVSGVAALAFEKYPGLSNVEIRTVMQNTADDLGAVGKDNYFGYGLIDALLE